MSYMEEIDAWLSEVLMDVKSGESEAEWLARIKPPIKQKILDSYRNGLRDGRKFDSKKKVEMKK